MNFGCYTSTEKNYDKLIVSLYGTAVHTLSGINEWQKLNVEVNTDGSHTITIAYTKDGSVNGNDDMCYVGDVSFCIYAPESDFTFDSSNGAITKYNGSGGAIVIPSAIGSVAVKAMGDSSITSSSDGVFANSNITSIVIPDDVDSIGKYTFYNCSNLTSVNIPDNITSIESRTFYKCKSLTSLILPEGLTNIGKSAFLGCSSLSNIVMPNSVTSVGDYAFSGCSKLSCVNIENVMNIGGYAFYNCTSLDNITISDSVFYDKEIRDIFFENCTNLKTVNIKGNGEIRTNLTVWGHNMFVGCTNLTTFNVDNDNINLTDIDGILYTKDLKTLIFCPPMKSGNIDIYDGTVIIGNGAFCDCQLITSVNIPESVKDISGDAFLECTSLKDINLPKNLESLGNSVFTYSNIESLVVPGTLKKFEINGMANKWGPFTHCENLRQIEFGEGFEHITNIFTGCNKLERIIIPKSVTSIDSGIFASCSENLVIKCYKNSTAHTFAEESSISYELLDAEYTITYDANGGSGAPDSQIKTDGKALTLSSDVPVKTGYKFLGWATSYAATEAEYSAGSAFEIDADTTLYAVWELIPTLATPMLKISDIPGGKSVTISAPSGATIYYTTNGNDPTIDSSVYNGSIDIKSAGTVTVKAIAAKEGYKNSVVALTAFNIIKATVPKASPSGGAISGFANVALTSSNGGTIYYTTDGSAPTDQSSEYTGAIYVDSSMTIKARVINANGYTDSDVAEFVFTRGYSLGYDNYRLKNSEDAFGYANNYSINISRYTDVLGMAKGYQEWSNRNFGKWNGACFGMATSSALFYRKDLSLSQYTDKALLHDIDDVKNNSELLELIEKCHILQFSGSLYDERYTPTESSVGNVRYNVSPVGYKYSNDFTDIISAVQNLDNVPIVLHLNIGSIAHAVLPYKIAAFDDNGNTAYNVYVYDSNKVDEVCILKLYDNKYEYLPMNITGKSYASLSYNTLEEVNNILNSQDKSTGNALTLTVQPVGGNLKIWSVDSTGNETECTPAAINNYDECIELVLPLGSYKIKNEGTYSEDFKIMAVGNDDYKSISVSDSDASIYIKPDSFGSTEFLEISAETENSQKAKMQIEVYNINCGKKTLNASCSSILITENAHDWFTYNISGSTKQTVKENGGVSKYTISKTATSNSAEITEGLKLTLDYEAVSNDTVNGEFGVHIYNATGEITSGILLVGIYDVDGQLIETIWDREEAIMDGENYIFIGERNYPRLKGGTYTIKAELWNPYDDTEQMAETVARNTTIVGNVYDIGDVNFDGNTDKIDSALIMKHISRIKELSVSQLAYADVNSDGTVDMLDVIAVLNK